MHIKRRLYRRARTRRVQLKSSTRSHAWLYSLLWLWWSFLASGWRSGAPQCCNVYVVRTVMARASARTTPLILPPLRHPPGASPLPPRSESVNRARS